MYIFPSPVPKYDDLKAKLAKPSPSFDISTLISKCQKRKNNKKDYDGRSQKRPKNMVFWPKVVSQTKCRKAPKVSNNSKT